MQIADAHNDFLTTLNSKEETAKYLNFCKNNEVVKIFTAYYVSMDKEKLPKADLLKDIKRKFKIVKNSPLCVPTFENIGFVNSLELLEQIINCKPFCATLTWNYDNILAGGAYGSSGFTKLGLSVVKKLEKNNILVDIAHLNDKSILQFLDITTKPLFCSHCCCRSVNNIPRNFNDYVLKNIGLSGGFVGLCLYNCLLGQDANFDLIYRHIDTCLNLAGVDSVGFGTDFNGTGEQNPQGVNFDYDGLQNLQKYLSKYYSEKILNKIFNQNLLDFKKKIENQIC